jgi:hypothetical protein
LKRSTALRACGTPLGMRIICPALTR